MTQCLFFEKVLQVPRSHKAQAKAQLVVRGDPDTVSQGWAGGAPGGNSPLYPVVAFHGSILAL